MDLTLMCPHCLGDLPILLDAQSLELTTHCDQCGAEVLIDVSTTPPTSEVIDAKF